MKPSILLFLLAAVGLACITAQAKVTRVEITARADVLGGREFSLAGAYERLAGRVYFTVDPNNVHNRVIVDLDKAPRNAEGAVEFSADLVILKPKDAARGNGTALFEVSNRGGRAMTRFFNRGRGGDEFGDGFLMRHGFTLVWVGWQFDVPDGENLLRAYLPIATDGGKPITGWTRSDFVFTEKTRTAPLGHRGQKAQPPVDPNSPDDKLTVRDTILAERRLIPRRQWTFLKSIYVTEPSGARTETGQDSIQLEGGFEPGKIYEVVYRTSNPHVVGLGLAAMRDMASYLKYERDAIAPVKRALGFGISQSGRFLRHFVYQGFNADERDRQVFDGINAHVAGGGRGSFNYRFAEPSRDASPFATFFFPTDIFPFTDLPQTDAETSKTDGLLTLAAQQNVAPKIFYTFSSYEYWGRAASLIHTSLDGARDAELPATTRIYFFPGGQHGPSSFPPQRAQTERTKQPLSQNLPSPNDYLWSMRALLLALDAWTRNGTEPPASQYARIADGSLVAPDKINFPKLPGVNFPRTIHEAWRVDYGPDFATRGLIAQEPPRLGRAFAVLAPQVDADGIDLGGIRLPEVAVPLATYTGWNPRTPETGAPGELVDFTGSFIPLAKTKADRTRVGDPRPSIEERYKSREDYLGRIAEAAVKLARGGYLLAEDVPSLIERAAQQWAALVQNP